MSVHKHMKRQKIYKPNRHQGEKSKILTHRVTEGHLPGYSGYIVSSTAFAESLKPLKAEHW